MRKGAAAALLFSALALGACSTLESLNPFASSGPKMAELLPIQTSVNVRIAWSQSVGKSGGYTFVPAVIGDSAYVAGNNGSLARIDDGQAVWKIDVGQTLSGGVAADEKIVVVGSPKGDVLAFSAADGSPLWKARASSEILAPAAIAQGLVVVRSGDNRLAAFDARDGNRKWLYQRPTPALSLRVTAGPLITDRFVFAGFPGGKLLAVSTANGAALWDGTVALPKGSSELDRVADVTSAPVISGRTICAVAFQGRVACFDLGSGNLIWARDMSSAAGLAIDTRYVYVSDDKGAVHALDLASGASLWKQDKLSLRRLSAPASWRNMVVVADVKGVVHFLSREDGSFVARLNTDDSPVVAPLQVQGQRLLVQTSKGGIYAIEAQ